MKTQKKIGNMASIKRTKWNPIPSTKNRWMSSRTESGANVEVLNCFYPQVVYPKFSPSLSFRMPAATTACCGTWCGGQAQWELKMPARLLEKRKLSWAGLSQLSSLDIPKPNQLLDDWTVQWDIGVSTDNCCTKAQKSYMSSQRAFTHPSPATVPLKIVCPPCSW